MQSLEFGSRLFKVNIMIRGLKKEDWEIFMGWMYELASLSFDKVVPKMLEEKIKSDYEREPSGFVVSDVNGEVNGVLWFSTIKEKKSVFIHAIYVKQEYRSRGVSDSLIKYLEEYCKREGLDTIEGNVTTNLTQAIKFYEKQGFKIKRYLMVKKLNFD